MEERCDVGARPRGSRGAPDYAALVVVMSELGFDLRFIYGTIGKLTQKRRFGGGWGAYRARVKERAVQGTRGN